MRWWSLTPPFHPYRNCFRRFVFCGTVPRVSPGGCYPPPRPVEPGLSSAAETRGFDHRGRPAGSPAVPSEYDTPRRITDGMAEVRKTRDAPRSMSSRGPLTFRTWCDLIPTARHVQILLPPSEGKRAPVRGRPLDLSSLAFPDLTPTRSRVLEALVDLARGPVKSAQAVLGISEYQAEELARDAELWIEPSAVARSVYTGVLYEALDFASLSSSASRRAARTVLISSGAFGVLRPTDRIPAYRLSGDTNLPGIGQLSALWKAPLTEALSPVLGRGLIVDLRSGAYAALMPIRTEWAPRTVTVRVLHERRVGRELKRTVVSHHNKATKGRLVRLLLESRLTPTRPTDLVSALRDLGFRCEPAPPDRHGLVSVDVIVDAL